MLVNSDFQEFLSLTLENSGRCFTVAKMQQESLSNKSPAKKKEKSPHSILITTKLVILFPLITLREWNMLTVMQGLSQLLMRLHFKSKILGHSGITQREAFARKSICCRSWNSRVLRISSHAVTPKWCWYINPSYAFSRTTPNSLKYSIRCRKNRHLKISRLSPKNSIKSLRSKTAEKS